MESPTWYYAANGQSVGPMSLADLAAALPRVGGPATMVFGPGMAQWAAASTVPALMSAMSGNGGRTPPPMPPPTPGRALRYQLFGDDMQYIEIALDAGETVVAEPGAMMFMSGGVRMETHLGDPNQPQQGLFDKLLSAGKRALTGESLFLTTFSGSRTGDTIAFAAPYPGKIIPMPLADFGGELIVQKDSFLCAALGVQVNVAFQKKVAVALFGGEGFIMQRLTGNGVAVVHAGGTIARKTLAPGEMFKLDTGCLVALTPSVNYDIQFTGGFKNTLFGGEGLFLATLTGPGDVWMQSIPFSRLAGRILRNAHGGKEEGNILGGIGLGTLLGGND